MRDWMIKMLGGYTKAHHRMYCEHMNQQLQAIVKKHDMQNAWEQIKQEKKQSRVH